MQRHEITERADWRLKADEVGFDFHTTDGRQYWYEGAYYAFSLREIEDDIESATEEIMGLCYEAVDVILGRDDLLRKMHVPDFARGFIAESWRRQDRDLYGRFDFRYDGRTPPKLYEFNGDTPTGLFEAAVFQWLWMEELRGAGKLPVNADQFNSIQERLIDGFHALQPQMPFLHLTCVGDHAEDRSTVGYLEDCARQGGMQTKFLFVDEIGLDPQGRFVDQDGAPIDHLFKLYPWEWLLREDFAQALPHSSTRFIEPPWKLLLSNKGLLAVLWQLNPGHPNLLPAYFEDDPAAKSLGEEYARKPIFGREGSNIRLVMSHGREVAETGPYGSEGYVRQALAPLPAFEGNYPVLGSWVVAGAPCGMGIREERTQITSNTARFVPHIIRD